MDVVKRLQIAQLKNSSEHLPAEMMALDQFSKKKKNELVCFKYSLL